MLASLLAPASSQAQPQRDAQGRISQLLPTVKCSTCHQPVALDALGEHICTAPPPVPQLRAPPPAPTPPSRPAAPPAEPSPPPPRFQPPPPHQRSGSGSSINSRLRVNTTSAGPSSPTKPAFHHTPSPLSRSASADTGGLIPPVNRTPSPSVNRSGGPGSNYSTPTTARPNASFNREPSPQPGPNALPPRNGTPGPSLGPPPPHMPSGPGMIRPPGPPGGPMVMPPTRSGSFPPNGPPPPGSMRGGGPPPPNMGYPPPRPPPGAVPPNMGPPPPRGPPPGPGPNMAPPPNMLYPPVINDPGMALSPADKFVPPAERGINTKTGGEAGMAGVGRRGFAAAARAAMFVVPHERPMGPVDRPMPTQYNRRPSAAQYLNIDTVPRSTDTPPLSPGSGYSSHSPGPTSPNLQSDFAPRDVSVRAGNTPSPPNDAISAVNARVAPAKPPPIQPTTPVASNQSPLTARLPFFEKFKNKIPGIGPNQESADSGQDTRPNLTSSPAPISGLSATRPRADTSTSASNSLGRSDTGSSSLRIRPREEEPQSPHDSDSEYSGLAYADSTDYEDDDAADDRRQKATPPPSQSKLPPTSSPMDRSLSNSSSSSSASRHQKQPSRTGDRSVERPGIRIGGGAHSRDISASSAYSSSSSSASVSNSRRRNGGGIRDNTPTPTPGDRDGDVNLKRSGSNSSVIAAALGLSQTPPSEYSRLGGPGVSALDKRLGRSYSNSSSGSGGPGPSVHHRRDGSSGLTRPAGFDKAMETLMEDIGSKLDNSAATRKGKEKTKDEGLLTRMDTSSSAGSRNLRYDFSSDSGSSIGLGVAGSGTRPQRSNTVQVPPTSPETKAVKLPMRSASGSRVEKDATSEGTKPLAKKARKPKVCLKCSKVIEDGRWVSMDGGGVLCEKCWKNLYLPKCRRCNLPIEKQAVSSSDGQLKGKYHKECFNCHQCHKPFPDKTFYVFDGRPLCAYHYHEANDSLCAAALCGQPIEGPCAVSHTGDRYHPEHMLCEYPGAPKCNKRLNEYWEVDGRMLCERHAASASKRVSNNEGGGYEDDEDDMYGDEWVQSSRAMKRVTQFIDLANLQNQGGSGAAGATRKEGRDDDDEGLR